MARKKFKNFPKEFPGVLATHRGIDRIIRRLDTGDFNTARDHWRMLRDYPVISAEGSTSRGFRLPTSLWRSEIGDERHGRRGMMAA
jgi:hypothetical protein